MNKNPLGIMQGRLLPPVGDKIQAFPEEGWPDEFLIAKELKLDCIEFIFDGDDYEKHPLMGNEGIDKIRETVNKTGVRVLSVCADYFMNFPLHKGSCVEKSISILNKLIVTSAVIGVKDIVIPCVDQSGLSNDNEFILFEKSIKKCIPQAEKHGVNLILETDLPPKDFLKLLNMIDSRSVKINYDTGNSSSLGYDPAEEIDAYGRLITDVHIKDRIYKGGTVPLGQGSADFGTVFEKLREKNFTGIFILQAARKEKGKEKETIKGYLDFIKKHFNRAGF